MMTETLIGRNHPAATLRAEIARAGDSHGGLVLVTGEAGIGKTTLVTDAMTQARHAGALVVSGACWDSDSAPGYWPWTQVIRALRRAVGEPRWQSVLQAAGPGLAVLLGEATTGDDAGPDGADSEFRLFDAVTTAIVSVSQQRPLVVVLDDLHWADAASLRLLEFAAQHTWFERVLLVGTYRDVEIEAAGHPLRPLVGPLIAKATTVTLTGLDAAGVAELMTRTAGTAPDPSLVAEVHRRTGGNPFFVEQTARLWHSGGSVTAIAPGVRDALSRRLSMLPPPVSELLTAASVLGREFQRQVLAATVAEPAAVVDRMLDQAAAARLVTVLGAGRFSFAHDLVRETLYSTLDEQARQSLHAAVVRTIDRAPALAEHVLPADLARHAYLAGPRLDPRLAVDILLAAAADAGRRLANDESIGHYRRALELAQDPASRVRITVDLGRRLYHSGEADLTWQHFEEAVALAEQLDDPELSAWLALVVFRHGAGGDTHSELRHRLIETAHQQLIGGTPVGGSIDQLAQELIMRSEVRARTGHDDEALKFSLWARHDMAWGPGSAHEREALTAEMEEVGRRSADVDTEAVAASFRWVALVELGDPRYLEQVRSFVTIVGRDSSPRLRMSSIVDRLIIATMAGRFDEAESLLAELDTLEHTGPSEFAYMGRHLAWALAIARGRFDEADEVLAGLTDTDHPYRSLALAITAVERGDAAVALRHLGAAEGELAVDPYPRSATRLWLRLQAQLAAATGDPTLCARVREALTPYRGEWAVSLWGCDISGPLDLWLAQVDSAQRRWNDAVAGFAAAGDSADRMRARPWAVRARLGQARALTARGAPGDADTARQLLAEVRREATSLGMAQIIDQLRPDSPASPAADTAYEFRRENATWRLGFGGEVAHMPDAKGLRDLHLLLSRPGVDIPAVELLDPQGGEIVVAAHRMGGDPILDDEAKARYKRRLAQLDSEIDRAAGHGDSHRLASLESERSALLDELRVAAGLAGRTRRLGDAAERARKTVTARIRDTLRRLDQVHPALAEHLRATVSTGATCRYSPPAAIDWLL
jgi:tetratricopeptide (TPR) repeat protein